MGIRQGLFQRPHNFRLQQRHWTDHVQLSKGGFTVVETLIFLAVSGFLIVGAMVMISGQQARTEFNQAINEMESRVRDVINDVSTGYYDNTAGFTCTPSATGPVIGPGVNNQGANQGCIFIGRVISFAEAGTSNSGYRIFTVVGLRRTPGVQPRDTSNLTEVEPRVIAPPTVVSLVPDASQFGLVPNGLRVMRVYYRTGATTCDIGSVGFFSNFSSFGDTGGLRQGARQTDLIPIPTPTSCGGGGLNRTQYQNTLQINTLEEVLAGGLPTNTVRTTSSGTTSVRNPDGGVVICLQNPAGTQHADLVIGSNSRQLGTEIKVVNGGC